MLAFVIPIVVHLLMYLVCMQQAEVSSVLYAKHWFFCLLWSHGNREVHET